MTPVFVLRAQDQDNFTNVRTSKERDNKKQKHNNNIYRIFFKCARTFNLSCFCFTRAQCNPKVAQPSVKQTQGKVNPPQRYSNTDTKYGFIALLLTSSVILDTSVRRPCLERGRCDTKGLSQYAYVVYLRPRRMHTECTPTPTCSRNPQE